MNRITDLIAKYCPNGVYYKKLGNVAEVYTGEQFNKRDMEEVGLYPVINGGILPSGYSDKYNETENTITVSQGGASAGYVNFINVRFWLGAHCYAIKLKSDILDNKFVFYCIKQQENKLMQSQEGAGIPSLNRKKLNSILIPVPPLEVQQEIARILDSFTSLEAELEAELEARKKQYEHYRGELLSFAKKPEILEREQSWQTLGEVCRIMNGKDYKTFGAGSYPVYGTGGAMAYIDTFVHDKPSVLIPRKGSIGALFYVEEPFWTVDTIYWTDIDTKQIVPKYLYYYLSTQNLAKMNTSVGSIPSLTQSVLKKIPIPVPSLAEQERIVAILDKFDELVNDISVGLPAEIDARRKQYEYYREKLLTFPMVGCDA